MADKFCTFELFDSTGNVYIARAADSPIRIEKGNYVLKVRLKDDTCTTPLVNANVSFRKDRQYLASATTDNNGVAQLTINEQLDCSVYRALHGDVHSPDMYLKTVDVCPCRQLGLSITCPSTISQGDNVSIPLKIITDIGNPPYVYNFYIDGYLTDTYSPTSAIEYTFAHIVNESVGQHTYKGEITDTCSTIASDECVVNVIAAQTTTTPSTTSSTETTASTTEEGISTNGILVIGAIAIGLGIVLLSKKKPVEKKITEY